MPGQCPNVKRRGQHFGVKPWIQARMNAGDNYNRPKVLFFNFVRRQKDWDGYVKFAAYL
jgi:hypothetical protein